MCSSEKEGRLLHGRSSGSSSGSADAHTEYDGDAELVPGIVALPANRLLIPAILGIILGTIGLRRAPAMGGRNKSIVGIVLSVVGAITGIDYAIKHLND